MNLQFHHSSKHNQNNPITLLLLPLQFFRFIPVPVQLHFHSKYEIEFYLICGSSLAAIYYAPLQYHAIESPHQTCSKNKNVNHISVLRVLPLTNIRSIKYFIWSVCPPAVFGLLNPKSQIQKEICHSSNNELMTQPFAHSPICWMIHSDCMICFKFMFIINIYSPALSFIAYRGFIRHLFWKGSNLLRNGLIHC